MAWRPDSQVRNARLANGRGNGFNRRAERVEQLGHLARAAGLPALLHDEAGQGDDICVEGRLVRHAEAGLRRAGRQVRAAGAGSGTRREDGATSTRTIQSLTGQGQVPQCVPREPIGAGRRPPAPGNTSAPGPPPHSGGGSAHAEFPSPRPPPRPW